MSRFHYVRDPDEIYRLSAECVASETDVSHLPVELRALAYRLVHACGMPEIVTELGWRGSPVEAATRALRAGASIIVDCEMVANGIIGRRLPSDNRVICTLNDARALDIQVREHTTRSAAAVELWREHMHNAVIAIGNAPTALYRLLELLSDAECRAQPAAVFAFPVGFVGAAESKTALVDSDLRVPYVTLRGRRGGSAMAAAAVNSLGGSLAS